MCIYHFNTANRKRFVRLIYEILIMLIMYINIVIIFRENVKCEEELFIYKSIVDNKIDFSQLIRFCNFCIRGDIYRGRIKNI